MREADGGVGGVDALPTRARRAESIDPYFVEVDLDVDFFRLRQHGHGDRRRVNAPLRLGGRNALYPVHTALVTKSTEGLFALQVDDRFANPATIGLRNRERLDLPAARLRVTGVHAKEIRGKECGFVSTGSRTNLEDGVLFLVGIFRHQQHANLAL